MKKHEQTQTTNKPRIWTNPKVWEWAPLASLTSQKQQTKLKKYEQTQNLNKPEKCEPSESRLLRKDNNKPNPKRNQSKSPINGWWNRITRKDSEQDLYQACNLACNRCATTTLTQIVETLTLSGRIILSYSSDHRITRHSVFTNCKFCLKLFSLKPIFIEVIWKTWKIRFFLGLNLEDVICAYFHGYIRNQQVKIRRYTKFQSDRRYLAFGSTLHTQRERAGGRVCYYTLKEHPPFPQWKIHPLWNFFSKELSFINLKCPTLSFTVKMIRNTSCRLIQLSLLLDVLLEIPSPTPHGKNFMAIFTTLSVVIWFSTVVCVFTMRVPYCFVICATYYCEFHHAVWWKSPYGYSKLQH